MAAPSWAQPLLLPLHRSALTPTGEVGDPEGSRPAARLFCAACSARREIGVDFFAPPGQKLTSNRGTGPAGRRSQRAEEARTPMTNENKAGLAAAGAFLALVAAVV